MRLTTPAFKPTSQAGKHALKTTMGLRFSAVADQFSSTATPSNKVQVQDTPEAIHLSGTGAMPLGLPANKEITIRPGACLTGNITYTGKSISIEAGSEVKGDIQVQGENWPSVNVYGKADNVSAPDGDVFIALGGTAKDVDAGNIAYIKGKANHVRSQGNVSMKMCASAQDIHAEVDVEMSGADANNVTAKQKFKLDGGSSVKHVHAGTEADIDSIITGDLTMTEKNAVIHLRRNAECRGKIRFEKPGGTVVVDPTGGYFNADDIWNIEGENIRFLTPDQWAPEERARLQEELRQWAVEKEKLFGPSNG